MSKLRKTLKNIAKNVALIAITASLVSSHQLPTDTIGVTVSHAASSTQASTKVMEVIRKTSPNLTTSAKPAPNIKINIDGKVHALKDPVLMENNRVFLPVRNLGDLLGTRTDYLAKEKVATVQSEDTYLELPLGYNQAVINKNAILKVDKNNNSTRILSFKDRTYLPVRFVSENLGYIIEYRDQVVYITTDGTAPIIPDKPATPVKPPTGVKPPVTTPDSEWMNPDGSKTPPTYKGKKEGEISKDGNWSWGQPEQEWLRIDPYQQGGIIDVGPIDINGPSNGNWN